MTSVVLIFPWHMVYAAPPLPICLSEGQLFVDETHPFKESHNFTDLALFFPHKPHDVSHVVWLQHLSHK